MSWQEKDWLKSLKAGDEVIVERSMRHTRGTKTTIAKVDKVTPTGRINVDGITFNPDGIPRGGGVSAWLVECTPEAKQKIIDDRTMRYARQLIERRSHLITLEEAKEIIKILEVKDDE